MKSNRNLSLLILVALLISFCGPEQKPLVMPVLGAKYVEGKDTVYHTIGNFSFFNQYGENVTNNTTRNKIYVANFFFVTCQTICPEMSTNLTDVQKQFADDDSVLILSHSVNPMHDTVEVLKQYAGVYGAQKGKWHLLTGDKKQIYDLAKDSYLVNALEDDGSPEGFLHSELLLLIDTKGRIRGTFDGTDKAEVQKLIGAIKLLKTEQE